MKGDLHCHSRASDGSMTPSELIENAVRHKIDCIALTDHDTMRGIPEAQKRADELNIRLIPGIEVSCFDYKNNKKVHLLCYNPINKSGISEICSDILKRRADAAIKMIEKASERYPVDLEVVKKAAPGSTVIYKQHIAAALMQMGYTLSVFGSLFDELFSNKNGFAYVNIEYPEAREVISVLKESGGMCVLAHPGVYHNFDLIEDLCGKGLDGLEVWHPRQSAEDCLLAESVATEHRLLKTGGSDFHGAYSSRPVPIGTKFISDQTLDLFLNTLKKTCSQ